MPKRSDRIITKIKLCGIKALVEKTGINPQEIEEVLMGNVLSANLGGTTNNTKITENTVISM